MSTCIIHMKGWTLRHPVYYLLLYEIIINKQKMKLRLHAVTRARFCQNIFISNQSSHRITGLTDILNLILRNQI